MVPGYVDAMSDDLGPWGPCPVCFQKIDDVRPHHSGDGYVTNCSHHVMRATEPGDFQYEPYRRP